MITLLVSLVGIVIYSVLFHILGLTKRGILLAMGVMILSSVAIYIFPESEASINYYAGAATTYIVLKNMKVV